MPKQRFLLMSMGDETMSMKDETMSISSLTNY